MIITKIIKPTGKYLLLPNFAEVMELFLITPEDFKFPLLRLNDIEFKSALNRHPLFSGVPLWYCISDTINDSVRIDFYPHIDYDTDNNLKFRLTYEIPYKDNQ